MSSTQDTKPPTSLAEDASRTDSRSQAQADVKPVITVSADKSAKTEGASATANQSGTANAAPLAPPPKPTQNNASETPDFFGSGTGSHFSREPNPFEQSFGVPAADTPGKFGGLPSVASLQSPAPLGPGKTPGWPDSLRSGPLSPAMLAGPANTTDYFSEHGFGSFPTPNESSLRTGLTPGGTGSMFPAPSPNSQAIFNSMQSGGATPSTLEFHRTAMQAAARSKAEPSTNPANAPTSQGYQPAQQTDSNMFSQPEGDAANSLYMLATRSGNANQFAQSGPGANAQMGGPSQDSSPTSRRGKQSHTGAMSDAGDYTGSENGDSKNSSRSKNRKSSSTKGAPTTNGRRKAEETPSKPNKKSKANSAGAGSMDEDDEEDDMHESGRKMTDEEKRKNFLERNRVAALKCRQRKKQWLQNLQNKVEIFSAENDALSQQVTQLREEIVNLKTLLLAHKDCPVSHQQGLGGAAMQQLIGDLGHHTNPYGMIAGGGQMMGMAGGQGMQRA